MRLCRLGVAVVLVGIASVVARADSLFNLQGTFQDGGTFSGTLDVNAQGSAYVQGTVTDGAFLFTLPTNYLGEQLGEGAYTDVDVFAVNAPFNLSLYFPNAAFVDGGALCSLGSYCPGFGVSSFSDGSLGPADGRFLSLTSTPASAVTPEPGTLMLLGTGLLGLAGVWRRSCAETAAARLRP